jgi:hypothetical protein
LKNADIKRKSTTAVANIATGVLKDNKQKPNANTSQIGINSNVSNLD